MAGRLGFDLITRLRSGPDALVEAERRRLGSLFAGRLAAHCAWPSVDAWSLGV